MRVHKDAGCMYERVELTDVEGFSGRGSYPMKG